MPNEDIEQEQQEAEIVSLLTTDAPKTKDRRSYEDYVSQATPETIPDATDNIEQDVPDKFKGKSISDVIESYTQLESEYGRRNSEVGSLRKLTDQLLELGDKKQEKAATPKEKVDVDTLLNDPDAAINAAATCDSNSLHSAEES